MNTTIAIKIANRHRFLLFITVTLMICLVITTNIVFQSSVEGERENKYMNIYVNSGDTLWSIAKKYNSDGQDIRQFIHIIVKENKLASAGVYPGQNIKIPVNTIQ